MTTCTKPLPRPEEPNVSNLPCGKTALFTFTLRDTSVTVGRCATCMGADANDLTDDELRSLRSITENIQHYISEVEEALG